MRWAFPKKLPGAEAQQVCQWQEMESKRHGACLHGDLGRRQSALRESAAQRLLRRATGCQHPSLLCNIGEGHPFFFGEFVTGGSKNYERPFVKVLLNEVVVASQGISLDDEIQFSSG